MKNNSTRLVSIIMPTYNRADYIGETIRSIRDQTYNNWELLVMDDGSTDHTEDILRNVKDERIQFWKGERTGILGKVKNRGLEKARGEFIAFIDSDDLWAPEKIEKQVAALLNNPGTGFSLTGGYNFHKPGKPSEFFYKQKEGILIDNILIALLDSKVAAITPSLILRKECLDVTGWVRETHYFSDVDLILRLAGSFKAVVLYEPLVYRRLHENNLSQSHWIKSHELGIDMLKSYRDQGLLPVNIARNALFRSHINFGDKYLRIRKRSNALIHYFKAWQHKPLSFIPARKFIKVLLDVGRTIFK